MMDLGGWRMDLYDALRNEQSLISTIQFTSELCPRAHR